MERIYALCFSAILSARSLFPDAVGPIIASCFIAKLYQLKGYFDRIREIEFYWIFIAKIYTKTKRF